MTTGLTFDWDEGVAHVRRVDAKLAAVIDAVPGRRLEPKTLGDPFVALAESVVYQQLTGKAAATIFGRVAARFGDGGAPDARRLVDASDDALREVGLSRAKAAALRDLSSRQLAGELPTLDVLRGMTDDAIVERLTVVRGVGRWTVEMLLIFRLGRPDVLPLADYGVRKGFARAYRKRAPPEADALARHGRRWSPFRTVASWYLWRATELPSDPPR